MIRKHVNIKFNLNIFFECMQEENNFSYFEVKSYQTKMVIINLSSSTTDDRLNTYKKQCDVNVKKLVNSRNVITEKLTEININK